MRGLFKGVIFFQRSKGGVFQGRNGSGVAIPSNLGHSLNLPEFQTMRRAGGYTGGLKPLIHPVFAVVAFDHFSNSWIPLGSSPGTGGNTGFTANAKLVVHKNDAVAVPLMHGAGGASRNTPRGFTVETGHENIGRSGKPAYAHRPHLNDLA